MDYANDLVERLMYLKGGEQVNNIIFNPYAWEEYDPEDIKKRLECLVPQNMFVIYHSKLLLEEKEK